MAMGLCLGILGLARTAYWPGLGAGPRGQAWLLGLAARLGYRELGRPGLARLGLLAYKMGLNWAKN